jgi:hypothetical protein
MPSMQGGPRKMGSLVATASLREFFKALLEDVISERPLSVTELTEFYLVNLLADFAATDRLFTQQTESGRDHEPLAILYHRARQQERGERIRTFRRLGDVSLYKAGFFSEAVRSGPVGTEYYIQMGANSYGEVADLVPASGFAPVYRELHEKFRALVEVLEEISARGVASAGPEGALRVYENWVRTGSERLEKVLVDVGLLTPKGLPN